MINDEFNYESSINLSDQNHSLTKIIERVSKNAKVLEFGPAKGILTKYLKEELNCKVTCVEIDEELAKLASPFSEKMIVADIDKLDFLASFGKEKFDIIIFADVLEHLYDPWRIIREAKNYLQDEGKIIASIPNIAHASVILSLLEDEFHYNPSGLLDKTHIRFFTKKSIYNFFESNGYFIEGIDFTKAKWNKTEFIFASEHFPESLIAFMDEKPEREIYQYIIVAKKTNQNFSRRFEDQEEKYQKLASDYDHLKLMLTIDIDHYKKVIEDTLKDSNDIKSSTSYKLFLKLAKLRKFLGLG